MISPLPSYERPPIVERVASVFADMDDEIFQARMDEWRCMVEPDFPVYQPLQEWLILVKEKDGVPLFDTIQPELRITPRFSKRQQTEGFDWSLRCPREQFTVNMHSSPEDPRRYAQLRHEFATWLPKWLAHFDVKKVRHVQLHYVNILDRVSIPDFTSSDQKNLLLDKVLNVFVNIPGQHDSLVPPYDCRATLLLDSETAATMQIHAESALNRPVQPAFKLDFIVRATPKKPDATADEILQLLDWAHERILERFELVFTEEAKQSFKLRQS